MESVSCVYFYERYHILNARNRHRPYHSEELPVRITRILIHQSFLLLFQLCLSLSPLLSILFQSLDLFNDVGSSTTAILHLSLLLLLHLQLLLLLLLLLWRLLLLVLQRSRQIVLRDRRRCRRYVLQFSTSRKSGDCITVTVHGRGRRHYVRWTTRLP